MLWNWIFIDDLWIWNSVLFLFWFLWGFFYNISVEAKFYLKLRSYVCRCYFQIRSIRHWNPCMFMFPTLGFPCALRWRHNERDGVSNHRRFHCWLRRISKKTSKLRVTGLCAGNSPVTGEFPAQKASNAENVSIWWRHHGITIANVIMRDCSSLSMSCWCGMCSAIDIYRTNIT